MRTSVIISVALNVTCVIPLLAQSQLASSIQSPSTRFGTIAGYVFDSEGKPVANAEVYAKILDDRPLVGRYPTSNTDKDGRFLVQNAWPGLNRIYASKEEDGYPDTEGFMYQSAQRQVPPEVLVLEGKAVRGVIIHLGKKCQRLYGQVVDTETRSPIKHANIMFYKADQPEYYTSFGSNAEGQFEILLPPEPTKFKVSAENYEQLEDLDTKMLMESAQGTTIRILIALSHVR